MLLLSTLACSRNSDAALLDAAPTFIVEASAYGDLTRLTCANPEPSLADWLSELRDTGGLVEDSITCDPASPGEIFCEFDLEEGESHAVVLLSFKGRRVCSIPASNFEVVEP